MISKKQIIFFTGLYFLIRILSYFFTPETSLTDQSIINSLLSLGILIFVSYLLIRKNNLGWYIILGEIILGGAGHFFGFYGLYLRTWLLIFSITIYFIQNLKNIKFIITRKRRTTIILFFLFITALSSFAIGYFNNPRSLVFMDFIPYLFLFYYFPFRNLIKKQAFKNLVLNLFISAVLAGAVFLIYSFIAFSSGLAILQDNYYHWFRDIASGKITDLGIGFFRIILDNHLFLVPALLYIIYNLIYKKDFHKYLFLVLGFLLLIVLSVNLTRIYWLAFGFGILFLFKKEIWKRWLFYTALSLVSLVVIFSSINLIASRGESLGWEVFGLRFGGIVRPSTEDSALGRMLKLPVVLEKIKNNPILGSGFGSEITVYSPELKTEITTSHYDWGYLEIWAEMGLFGLLAWLILLVELGRKLKNNKFLFSSLICFVVINITSPALFHVAGVLWILVLLSLGGKVSFKKYLGKTLKAHIDRPLGSKHPQFDITYKLNYGFALNTLSGDGDYGDVYVLDDYKPIKKYKGKCIAIVEREDDDEDKLILSNRKEDEDLSEENILNQIYFQEKFFKSKIIKWKK